MRKIIVVFVGYFSFSQKERNMKMYIMFFIIISEANCLPSELV